MGKDLPRGLFDYGVDYGLPSEVKVTNECQIIRRGSQIETPRLYRSSLGNGIEKLINVEIDDNHYWVSSSNLNSLNPKETWTWLLLNEYNEGKGAELREGDVIRMGACSFLVKKIAIFGNKSVKNSKYVISPVEESDSEIKGEVKCRICFHDENTKKEPMVSSPCKCSGSVKYLHLNCLRLWFKSQVIERKNKYFHSYSWKELKCDICGSLYPSNLLLQCRYCRMS